MVNSDTGPTQTVVQQPVSVSGPPGSGSGGGGGGSSDPFAFIEPDQDNISVLPAQHKLPKNRKLAGVRHNSDTDLTQSLQNGGGNGLGSPQQRLPNGSSSNRPVQSPPPAGHQHTNGGPYHHPQQPQQQQRPQQLSNGPGSHLIALPPPPPIPSPVVEQQPLLQQQQQNGPMISQWSPAPTGPMMRPMGMPPQHHPQQQPQMAPRSSLPLYQLPLATYEQRQQQARQQFIPMDQPQPQFQPLAPVQSAPPQFLQQQQQQQPIKQQKAEPKEPKQRKNSMPVLQQQQPQQPPPQNGLHPSQTGHPHIPPPLVLKSDVPMNSHQTVSLAPGPAANLPVLNPEELLDSKTPILARVSFGAIGSRLPNGVARERPATRNKGIIQQCSARLYFPSEAAFMAYAYWASRRMFHSDILGQCDSSQEDDAAVLASLPQALATKGSPVVEDVDTEIAEMPMRSEWFATEEELVGAPSEVSPSKMEGEQGLKAIENRRIAIDRLRASLKQAVVLRRAAFKTNTMPRGHNALEAQQLAQLFAEDRRLLYRLLHRTRISQPDRSLVKRLLRRAGSNEVFAPQNKKRCACDITDATNLTQNDAGQNCNKCPNPALPFANHCPLHITYSVDQKLFEHCTGRHNQNNLQRCLRPAFDPRRPQAPLCQEHAVLGTAGSWNGSQPGATALGQVPGGATTSGADPTGQAPAKSKKKKSNSRAKKKNGDKTAINTSQDATSGLASSFGSPNTSQNQGQGGFGDGNNNSDANNSGGNNNFDDILNSSHGGVDQNNPGDLDPNMHLFDDDMIGDFLSSLPADSRDFHRILQDTQHLDRHPGDLDPFGPGPETHSNGPVQNGGGGSSGAGSTGGENGPSQAEVAMLLGEDVPTTTPASTNQNPQQQNFGGNMQQQNQNQQYQQPLQSPSSVSSVSATRPSSSWPALSPSNNAQQSGVAPGGPTQQQIAQQQAQHVQQQMQSPGPFQPQQQQFGMMPPPWSPNGPVQQQQVQQGGGMDFPPPSPQRPPQTPQQNQQQQQQMFFGQSGGPNTPQTPQGAPMNGFVSPGPQGTYHHGAPQGYPPQQQQQQQQPGTPLMKVQSMGGPQNGPGVPMSPHQMAAQQQFGQPQHYPGGSLHRSYSQPGQPQQMEMSHGAPPHMASMQRQQQQQQQQAMYSSPMHPQQGQFAPQQQQQQQPGPYPSQQQAQFQQQQWAMQQQQQGFAAQQNQQMYMAQQQYMNGPQQQYGGPSAQQQAQMIHHHPPSQQNRGMYQ